MELKTQQGQHAFEVQLWLNDVDPNSVRVELYAEARAGGPPVRQEMTRLRQMPRTAGGYIYGATVPAARPPSDYTPRVMPTFEGLSIPLEIAPIAWRN